jgi:hypothetical protein
LINHCIGQLNCTDTWGGASSNGTKLDKLANPRVVTSDGNGGLYVGDSGNNRDIHFPAPLATNEAGDLLLGELSASATEQLSAHTESGMDWGGLCYFTANGKVGVCKVATVHNRALCWNDISLFGQPGEAPETDADAILGQADGTTGTANLGGLSATSLSSPYGCTADANYLYIADSGNNRITKYAFGNPALATHQSAVACIGQSGGSCTTAVAASSATGLSAPVDVKVSAAGNLWIVDQGNVRVVLDCINGETDQVCTLANSGDHSWDLNLGITGSGVCTDPGSASRFCKPWSVIPYGASVFVADVSGLTDGARIQEFDQPWSSGMDATSTLGQVATNRLAPRGGVCVGGPLAGSACSEADDWYLQGTPSTACPYGYCSYAVLPLRGNLPISMAISTRHMPAHLWASMPAKISRWTAPFHTGEPSDLTTGGDTNHEFYSTGSGYVPFQPCHGGGGIVEMPDGSIWYSQGCGAEEVNAIWAMMDPEPAYVTTPCAGDCNDDRSVTIDEILTMVNIALGNTPLGDCLAGDTNGDRQITIDEILTAVNNALNGCT